MKISELYNPKSPVIERNMRMVQWRARGRTYKSIGDHFGVTLERARQIISRHNRDLSAPAESTFGVSFRKFWSDKMGAMPPELS